MQYNFNIDSYHVQIDNNKYECLLFQGNNVIDSVPAGSKRQATQIGENALTHGYDTDKLDPWY